MQGAVSIINQGRNSVNSTLKLDYINIPILMNVTFVRHFSVKAGIQPGLRLNNAVETRFAGDTYPYSVYGVRLFDISLPVGIVYENRNIMLDLMINEGLITVHPNTSAKKIAVQLSVGYRLKL